MKSAKSPHTLFKNLCYIVIVMIYQETFDALSHGRDIGGFYFTKEGVLYAGYSLDYNPNMQTVCLVEPEKEMLQVVKV
jgi:hypothetical protein